MYKAVIIADDFSSVTDCGVQFTMRGLSTTAVMNLPDALPTGEVLSVDTDSRPLHAEEAYKRVYQTETAIKASGCKRIYKSVDSTLRGNLGAEIDAVMDAMNIRTALIAPAFPHYGRTIIDGVHYLNGTPLSETSLARDPVSPMLESELDAILRRQTKRNIGHISLAKLRAGGHPLRSSVKELLENGAELVTFDTETEADLQTIANLAFELPEALVAGSTGLAQYMAEGWRIGREENRAPALRQEAPLLFVAASASPVTAEQIERLLKHGGAYSVLLEPWKLVETHGKERIEEAYKALAMGKDVVLHLDSSVTEREHSARIAAEHGIAREEFSRKIVLAMASLAKELLDTGIPGGLFMTGGDTAKTLCTALESNGMELIGEIEPGIPYGWLTGARKLLTATKAGAFGTTDVLDSARKIMRTF